MRASCIASAVLLFAGSYAQSPVGNREEIQGQYNSIEIISPQCNDNGSCPYPMFDPNVVTSVSYVNVAGRAIIFGDVIVDTVAGLLSHRTDLAPGVVLKRKRGNTVLQVNRWPGGRLRYKYGSQALKTAKSPLIDAAIKNWRAIHPWLIFQELPVGPPENEVLQIIDDGSSCSSYVGFRAAPLVNELSLNDGCSLKNTVHEIGHALGLFHEHQRRDRAAAGIVFNCKNLQDYSTYATLAGTCCPSNSDGCCGTSACCRGKACNFVAEDPSYSVQRGAYDLDSCMHYADTSFAGRDGSNNLLVVMQGAPTQAEVAVREFPSIGDSQAICDLYSSQCGGFCGDGVRQAEEECDFKSPAGSFNGTCSRTCKLEKCGDGIIQAARGEECDPGTGLDELQCTRFCKFPKCGDGIIQAHLGETCDDGNLVNGDGCSSTCQNETIKNPNGGWSTWKAWTPVETKIPNTPGKPHGGWDDWKNVPVGQRTWDEWKAKPTAEWVPYLPTKPTDGTKEPGVKPQGEWQDWKNVPEVHRTWDEWKSKPTPEWVPYTPVKPIDTPVGKPKGEWNDWKNVPEVQRTWDEWKAKPTPEWVPYTPVKPVDTPASKPEGQWNDWKDVPAAQKTWEELKATPTTAWVPDTPVKPTDTPVKPVETPKMSEGKPSGSMINWNSIATAPAPATGTNSKVAQYTGAAGSHTPVGAAGVIGGILFVLTGLLL